MLAGSERPACSWTPLAALRLTNSWLGLETGKAASNKPRRSGTGGGSSGNWFETERSFTEYDSDCVDLEKGTLQPLDTPLRPKL